MANKLGVNSVNNNVNFLYLDANPSTDGIGYPAQIGSIAVFVNGGNVGFAQKIGAGNLDWIESRLSSGSYKVRDSEEAEESTTSGTFVTKFSLSYTAPVTQRYVLDSSYEERHSDTNRGRYVESQVSYTVNGGASVVISSSYNNFNEYDVKRSYFDLLLNAGDVLVLSHQFRRSSATAFMRRNRISIYGF